MSNHSHDPLRQSPQVIGFLLLDSFTLISLASAVEPLRMANQLAGRELYRWFTMTADMNPVLASDGLKVSPDGSIHDANALDTVIVCGGVGIQRAVTQEHINWLQSQARKSRRLGGVCTGSWALAQAGLLDGYDCSVHWECLTAMQEAFSRVRVSTRLFTLDHNRFTSSGGTAPLDMMLHLISRDHGRELSAAISEMFVYERIRNEQDHQKVPLKHTLGAHQPKLQEIVALMEANLGEPINLDELASFVALSRRQLERMFQKHLHCSPSRYYLILRLVHARQLLKQTPLTVVEVAALCGFVSTPHFSKCYREYYAIPPRDERLCSNTSAPAHTVVVPHGKLVAPLSGATGALNEARGESTFASIKL